MIELTMPKRADYASEAEFCRAMQAWALHEVPVSNPQRIQCVNDWFAEEFLLAESR